ncbi:MAG: anion permease [Treponema sp.]|jgi:sodium-dependent dicarboxylate transporter 2/3/5|nr:anion permease [Treponema sp.]
MDTNGKVGAKAYAVFGVFMMLIILSQTLPLPEGLTRPGMAALLLLASSVILWITEVMPLTISTFLILSIMPYFGIMTFADVWREAANTVFFFVLATFALTGALVNTNIPVRIASVVLRWAGTSSGKLVFGFILGAAVLSSVMSNVPTCALFASLAITIIKANGDKKPGETNLGRALMIGVPAGSVLGGFMTPAGGPTNIIAINFLNRYADVRITFLDWMILGIPLGFAGVALVSIIIVLIFKPEPVTEEALQFARKSMAAIGPLSPAEIKTLTIIALMFVFWISSTWIPAINTTAVALLGMVCFFLPGVRVLNWRKFNDNASWDVLFMIGGVGALAAGVLSTGAASWIIDALLANAASWPTLVTLICISATTCFLHILIPSGPAVVGLTAIPMISVALICGISPAAAAVITAFWGGVTFVLPMDSVPLLTYRYGYYKMIDMVKSGIPASLILILVVALGAPPILRLLGY